jgi:metallophosphoesterase superfamily enzyme
MLKVCLLHPEPALLICGKLNKQHSKFIVVADLHIGSETYGVMNGITMNTKYLIQNINNCLLKLVKSTNADGIILLGDFKSSVAGITQLERNIVPAVLTSVSQYAEVYLIPGNHDSFMSYIAPNNVNLISAGGMVLGDILLMHGHTMPSTVRSSVGRIIMGHIHPIFLKPNNIANGQRIWVYMKVRKQAIFSDSDGFLEILIMPSFYSSPNTLLRYNMWKSMPPVIERVIKDRAIEEMLLLTLDGSIVADLSCLEGNIFFNFPRKET